jgi:hypothetical protein
VLTKPLSTSIYDKTRDENSEGIDRGRNDYCNTYTRVDYECICKTLTEYISSTNSSSGLPAYRLRHPPTIQQNLERFYQNVTLPQTPYQTLKMGLLLHLTNMSWE